MQQTKDELYFGHPAALKDENLTNYFIHTVSSDVVADLGNPRCIIVGKKGCGKTAIFSEWKQSPSESRLVVQISPKTHQLTVIRRDFSYPHFANVFAYEILLEILRSFSSNSSIKDKFNKTFRAKAWLEGGQYLKKMSKLVDLSELTIDTPVFGLGVATKEGGNEVLRLAAVENAAKLQAKVRQIAKNGIEVLVLIDDPDLLFGEQHNFVPAVGGLLHAAVDLSTEGSKNHIKICVFVKQHKYDQLAKKFEDFDHLAQNAMTLAWTEDELVSLISERVRFKEKLPKSADNFACWASAFDIKDMAGLGQIKTFLFSYLTNGPRDLIVFCNLGMRSAQESGRTRVSMEDLKRVVVDYSNDCLNEVEREYGDVYPDIADVVKKLFDHEPLRKKKSISRDALQQSLSERFREDEIQQMKAEVKWLKDQTGRTLLDILFKVGILGFFSAGKTKARIMSYNPRSVGDSVTNAQEFFIHPAYHSALGIV